MGIRGVCVTKRGLSKGTRIMYLWLMIVSIGVAVPLTVVLLLNITLKILAGDSYELNLNKLFKIYVGALVCWGIVVQVSYWG